MLGPAMTVLPIAQTGQSDPDSPLAEPALEPFQRKAPFADRGAEGEVEWPRDQHGAQVGTGDVRCGRHRYRIEHFIQISERSREFEQCRRTPKFRALRRPTSAH